MNFSFGYCAGPNSLENLQKFLKSLRHNFFGNLDSQVEVIVSGEINPEMFVVESDFPEFKFIFHDFKDPNGKIWLTKKKNQIAQIANHDNLFILHDYYRLGYGVITNYIMNSRLNVDLYMFPINNREGNRHSDWLLSPVYMQQFLDAFPEYNQILMDYAPHENAPKYICGLPFSEKSLTKYQYISGGFVCCKKHVLLEEPFNESLYWGDAEDVEWSQRVLSKYKYDNLLGTIIFCDKPGKWTVTELPNNVLSKIKSFYLKKVD